MEAAANRKGRWRADASIGPYAGGAGECGRPEGYWRGKVRHPSVACGDTSPCRGGFWGGSRLTASPARGGGCAARRRRRGALPVGGGGIRQGPAGACPVSVGDDAGIVPQTLRRRQALRRAKSPALQSTRKRAMMRKRQLSARSAGGPMRASALTQGAGGVRQTGRVLARQGAAPLRRLRRHLPLQGRLLGGQCPQRPVGPVVGRILLADAGIGSCAGKALGAKGKPPRRQMRAEGAGVRKRGRRR